MTSVFQVKKIKSADRVLEIFEMFSHNRQEVTVMEVARHINAPQSSTSELLGSLIRLGYLVRVKGTRLFRPTARVALLGAWVHPNLFRNGNLLGMMDRIREQSNMGVVLGSLVGATLKHVHTVGDFPEKISNGANQHPLMSPLGDVLLSKLSQQELRLLVHRLNAESLDEYRVNLADVVDRLQKVSRSGFAIGKVAKGICGISVLLPQSLGDEQLSIGIIGPTEKIEARKEELIRLLKQVVSKDAELRVATSSFGIDSPRRKLCFG